MEAANNQLLPAQDQDYRRAVLKAKMSRIAAVGEPIWSELMGDEQMYGVWGMFELLSSIFRANLRDLDVNLKTTYLLLVSKIFTIWLIVLL
jgi:hypothetical protein